MPLVLEQPALVTSITCVEELEDIATKLDRDPVVAVDARLTNGDPLLQAAQLDDIPPKRKVKDPNRDALHRPGHANLVAPMA